MLSICLDTYRTFITIISEWLAVNCSIHSPTHSINFSFQILKMSSVMHFRTAFYVLNKELTNFSYNLSLSFVLTLKSFNKFQKLMILWYCVLSNLFTPSLTALHSYLWYRFSWDLEWNGHSYWSKKKKEEIFGNKVFYSVFVTQHTICVCFSACLCMSSILRQLLDYWLLNILSKETFNLNLNFSVYSSSDISILTL